ncbi:MAG TPA: adenylate/guanylate cyclase domain-containing protein, partial [Chthoniobacterales bacterium]|nr:adenylate/guanylate cyclase domain-containing protein [Chthoniobacterales bacterium]
MPLATEAARIQASIVALEAQRAALGDAVVEPALAALRQQLAARDTPAETESAREDERKIVTIVFADVSGFTALSEKNEPEEVRALMNACFESLVPVVQKYEGTIDKFIGDEIMALFGAPVAHEDDPERALHAALEMMDMIAAINEKHGTALGLHIGINTGPVIAGQVGAENRRDYSVMGDAVNLAARLEDASSEGEIFVGPSTYRATAILFNFEAVPPLNLKGKERAVQVHRLISAKAKAVRARGIEGLHAPLTGREAELTKIREPVRELAQGRGCILSIIGEAGLGKSRLIIETRALLPQNTLCAEGRALSYTTARSYWLTRELIYDLLDVTAESLPEVIGERLAAELARLFAERVGDYYPYLAQIVEVPLEPEMEERVKFLSGEALQARIVGAFREFVRQCATRSPLVLVWEDLHWSDPSSLQLLEEIAPIVTTTPLLLVCAARPEENRATRLVAELGDRFRDHSLRLELKPLSGTESGALMQALLNMEDLPQELRDLILTRAEGNPFYMEELLRVLLDSGAVVLEGGAPKLVRKVESIDVPDTVQGVLAARIDRLEPENKAILQKAAVIGRVFDRAVLAELHSGNGAGDAKLISALEELQRRQFIQQSDRDLLTATAAPEQFAFRHAITHDVAYESLLLATRKHLHATTARALEQLFAERVDELAPALGFHYERAGYAAGAMRHLARAAERAQAMFANNEALAFYQAAIVQAETLGLTDEAVRITSAKLHEGAADVLTLLGRHDEARAALERARALAPPTNRAWQSRLYRKTGRTHNLQRHYAEAEQAYEAADRALGPVEEASEDWREEKAQIVLDRMQLLYWQGRAREMNAMAKQYRDVIQCSGDPIQRGRYFQMLGLSRLTASRYRPDEECIEQFKHAVAASEGATNLSESSHIRFTVGLAHVFRGDFQEAIADCEAALRLTERCGDLVMQTRCLNYLALGHRRAH